MYYARRAKYLSAFGQTPDGMINWHNFRLNRIRTVKPVPWQVRGIPKELLTLRSNQALPTPDQVETEWQEAWGTDFYLDKALMILRFQPDFPRRYVTQTHRHPTFQPIAYTMITALLIREVRDPHKRATIAAILSQRDPSDHYFQVWVRAGDTSLTMRLRDWRPNGEVIAPLSLRHQMRQEAEKEL